MSFQGHWMSYQDHFNFSNVLYLCKLHLNLMVKFQKVVSMHSKDTGPRSHFGPVCPMVVICLHALIFCPEIF